MQFHEDLLSEKPKSLMVYFSQEERLAAA